jgi:prepilin-type N-terminal cleavage/methylation domain-containing protein
MRRAFTLVEVIVALTIAGLIALAARAAIVGGLDTQERLARHTAAGEADARFRALLIDGFRHMADAPAPGLQPFTLRDTVHNDVPGHVAEFYSRGFAHPAGTGQTVLVRVAPSPEGLTLSVEAPDGSLLLRGTLTDVAAMRVRARAPGGDWVAMWPRTLQLPTAVEIAFTPAQTRAAAPLTMIVATQLDPVP